MSASEHIDRAQKPSPSQVKTWASRILQGVERGRNDGLLAWANGYHDRGRRRQQQTLLETEHPDELRLYVMGARMIASSSGICGGGASSERERELAWEKVVERCRFVSSIREERDWGLRFA